MSPEKPEQNPNTEEMNIRSPEERYGGEGHAGSDPFAPPKSGKDRKADTPDEVPNATVEELVETPPSAGERARDDSGAPATPKNAS